MTGHYADDDRTRSYHSVTAGASISHYKILSRIGAGGMGEVYLAEDTSLNRKVALKFLSDQLSTDETCRVRFRREAQAAAALNHDNIVTIHEVSEHDHRPYFSMEYLPGQSLRDLLKRRSLTLRESLDIVIGICGGLAEAHRAGIIHRDIKPSNIVIDSRARPKLVDFGLACIRDVEGVTRQGGFVGTVGYLAPEVVKGVQADARSDIFSVGILLYELVTGQSPFLRPTEEATLYAIVHEQPERAAKLKPDLHPGIDRVLDRALRKNPDERYQTVDDIIAALKPIRESFGRRASDVGSLSSTARALRSPGLIGISVVVLFFALLVALSPEVRRRIAAMFEPGVPDEQYLVVLPFSDIGTEHPGRAFCDGMAETLASKLTQLERFTGQLSVVPISDVRQRGVTSAREARSAFGANLAIAGSIQSFGSTMRITLNLIDTKSQLQIRSQVIDHPASHLVALQDSTVMAAARMLDLSIAPAGKEVIRAGQTDESAAYSSYLQGRGHLQDATTPAAIDSAIQDFERALGRDQDYGLALAGLGEAYWRKYLAETNPRWEELALYNARRAIEISDDLAPAYVTMGTIYDGTGRYEDAAQQFEQALKVEPGNREALGGLAGALEAQQAFDSAEVIFRHAIDVDRDNSAAYTRLGLFYARRGRYEDAVAQLDRAVEAGPRGFYAWNNLGGLYYQLGQTERASDMWQHSLAIEPNFGALSNLGAAYHVAGEYGLAAEKYRAAIEMNDRDYRLWLNLGSALHELPGRDAEMLKALETGIDLGEKQRAINPHNAELLSNLADAYSLTGEDTRATRLMNEALELDSGNVQIQLVAGTVFEEIGDRATAIKHVVQAIRLGYPIENVRDFSDFEDLIEDEDFHRAVERLPVPVPDSA